jgi:hypothetical protein
MKVYSGLVHGDGDKTASSIIACASALLDALKIPYVAQGFEGVSISLMSNLQVRRWPIDSDLADANRADKVCRSNDKMQNDALAKRPRDEDRTLDKVSDPALSGASAIATNSRCSRVGRMA